MARTRTSNSAPGRVLSARAGADICPERSPRDFSRRSSRRTSLRATWAWALVARPGALPAPGHPLLQRDAPRGVQARLRPRLALLRTAGRRTRVRLRQRLRVQLDEAGTAGADPR